MFTLNSDLHFIFRNYWNLRPTLIEIKSSQIILSCNHANMQLIMQLEKTLSDLSAHLPVNYPHVTFRYISPTCSDRDHITTEEMRYRKRNQGSEIVRYVGTSRAHCRYLEPNANNNLTFREMHEPISGFYRHGLASEPLTLENFEKFDVATCLSPIRLRVCFGHVPSTESVFPMVGIF